jgi:hypothetical protein
VFFVDDLAAQVNAFVANVHRTWSGNQSPNLLLPFATE